jgi:phosphoenolpyruvate---glycerone phosphotransferase subunit DhaL
MSGTWARAWLRASAAAVAEQRAWLTDLDAAIGDGDHGINLDRGLRRVLEALDDPATADLPAGDLLESAGRVIMGSVGGASGALYGRALQRAGAALTAQAGGTRPPRSPDALPLLVCAFDAAVEAIAGLGRAVPGDKTMLDALAPAS